MKIMSALIVVYLILLLSDIQTSCEVMIGEYTMDSRIQHGINIFGAVSDVPRPASGSGISFIREWIQVNKLFGKWSGVLIKQTLIVVGVQCARLVAATITGNPNTGLLVIFITIMALHEVFLCMVQPLTT